MKASLVFLIAALTSGGARADHYDQAMEALGDGRLERAWELLEEPSELAPLARWRGRTAVLRQAGDLPGALGAARRGLELAPADQDLLYQATAASLALRDAGGARAFLDRLEAALQGPDQPAPEHLPAWERAAAAFRSEAQRLTASRAVHARAGSLARTTVLVVSLLVAAAVGTAAWRLEERRAGRESSPSEA